MSWKLDGNLESLERQFHNFTPDFFFGKSFLKVFSCLVVSQFWNFEIDEWHVICRMATFFIIILVIQDFDGNSRQLESSEGVNE